MSIAFVSCFLTVSLVNIMTIELSTQIGLGGYGWPVLTKTLWQGKHKPI